MLFFVLVHKAQVMFELVWFNCSDSLNFTSGIYIFVSNNQNMIKSFQ